MDVHAIAHGLECDGYASLGVLLQPGDCDRLVAAYADDAAYRSRVVMARHNFGRGEYKYYAQPLPEPVARLRTALYAALVPIANDWMAAMRSTLRFPATHDEFLARCAAAGQQRPTPLILHYEPGDFNCLHQDVYGDVAFPLQVVVMLSEPEREYSGGAFVLVEQRPRMQSRASALRPARGEAIVFPNDERPVPGARGSYRVKMRHGVSRVTRGERFALGIVFHDAR